MISWILIYVKGMFMGLADLVPGISGGTIAFLTGIYERFIKAISSISPLNMFSCLSSYKKGGISAIFKKLKELEFIFLFVLICGILTSVFLGAVGISYLFSFYEAYVLIFFIGLILSSSFFMYKQVEWRKGSSVLLSVIGFIIGFSLLFLPGFSIGEINIFQIFLAGFIASSAMILPGVSGSFLLLVFGFYHTIINFIANPLDYTLELLILGIGIFLGLIILSRILKKIILTKKVELFSFLLGLVLGSLFVPWYMFLELEFSIYISLILFTIGFILGFYLNKISKF